MPIEYYKMKYHKSLVEFWHGMRNIFERLADDAHKNNNMGSYKKYLKISKRFYRKQIKSEERVRYYDRVCESIVVNNI